MCAVLTSVLLFVAGCMISGFLSSSRVGTSMKVLLLSSPSTTVDPYGRRNLPAGCTTVPTWAAQATAYTPHNVAELKWYSTRLAASGAREPGNRLEGGVESLFEGPGTAHQPSARLQPLHNIYWQGRQ